MSANEGSCEAVTELIVSLSLTTVLELRTGLLTTSALSVLVTLHKAPDQAPPFRNQWGLRVLVSRFQGENTRGLFS